MTPKEKAEDIIDSFVRDGYDIVLDEKQAKRCALIAVDDIIKALDDDIYIQGETDINSFINYWKEVKHEIEKL